LARGSLRYRVTSDSVDGSSPRGLSDGGVPAEHVASLKSTDDAEAESECWVGLVLILVTACAEGGAGAHNLCTACLNTCGVSEVRFLGLICYHDR
jgi:hypothetical protein